MTTEKFSGSIGTFQGVTISPELPFEGTYDAYSNYQEVPEKEKLSDDALVKIVNNSLKASARAKEMEKVLKAAGYEKPTTADPAVMKAKMIKTFASLNGISESEAASILDAAASAVSVK